MLHEYELDHKIWMPYDDLIKKLGLSIGEAVELFIKEKLYTEPPNKYDYHYPTEFAKTGDFFNPAFVLEVLTEDYQRVFRWNYLRVRQQIFHETMSLMGHSNLPDLRDW